MNQGLVLGWPVFPLKWFLSLQSLSTVMLNRPEITVILSWRPGWQRAISVFQGQNVNYDLISTVQTVATG